MKETEYQTASNDQYIIVEQIIRSWVPLVTADSGCTLACKLYRDRNLNTLRVPFFCRIFLFKQNEKVAIESSISQKMKVKT